MESDPLDNELALRPVKALQVHGITIDLSTIDNIERAEACWKTVDENVEWFKGELLLHVKTGFGGRGKKGGISAFCRNVGITRTDAYELMRLAFLMRSAKVSDYTDRFRESGLTITHLKLATRKLPFRIDNVQNKGSIPEEAVKEFQERLDYIQTEDLNVAQTESWVREHSAKKEYENKHGPSTIDLEDIRTANVLYIEVPEDIEKYAHGSVPEEILKNIIWVYVNKGDLVLDPLAGTGTLAKVCRRYGWPCLSYDNDPDCYENNDDIEYNDIRDGLPEEVWQNPPAFIFIDPPYFNKREKELRRVGKPPPFKDFPKCYRFLRHIVDLSARALKEGGYLGFIIMDYLDTDTEDKRPKEYRYDVGLLMRGEIYRILADHPDLIIEEGWQVPIPPGRRGRKHSLVRKDKGVVACSRDIWIAKKVSWKPYLICSLCKDLYPNPVSKGAKSTAWPVACESCSARLEEKFGRAT